MNEILASIDSVVNAISGVLYNPWVPVFLLAAGLIFSFRSKFVQFRLLGESFHGVRADRGKWFFRGGSWILPTYHPSALLRDPTLKRAAWEDMLSVRERAERLGILPARGANA